MLKGVIKEFGATFFKGGIYNGLFHHLHHLGDLHYRHDLFL